MKISDIFKQGSVETNRADASKQAKDAGKSVPKRDHSRPQNEDTVTISSMSRSLVQVSRILSDEESESLARVDAIREKIASGSYDVSSQAIAQSMFDYQTAE